MITDEDPLRGLLFYWELVFFTHYTFLQKGDEGAKAELDQRYEGYAAQKTR